MKCWYDNILVSNWLPEGQSGNWSVRRTVVEGDENIWLANGMYPDSHYLIPNKIYTGLYLQNGDQEQRVMFDEPKEIKEAQRAYNKAKGDVLITGLGLGMVAMWIASKPKVKSVHVIENSSDVMKLVASHLSSPKIEIMKADAFTYKSEQRYDFIWHDCWLEVPEHVEQLYKQYEGFGPQDHWQPNVF